ncbi:MAG TPA: dTMP kinase [Acidimicrobiia bacterium]|jgi:dTMP kinase|nr:dTMP kinase [Actinomycetota bacterium]HIG25095.1 dTMP kinase [Acidimicrobiia bacterium]MBT3747113.1 dTMP kinase [Actinomycetota bacterium]MBT3969478.1 dTMP kinase [Actinomycetota bacterium]MBT4010267.1 dTMP kinase [Actinomycetota bacterium]
MTGRLVAFEGGEGSGKSTQAQRLADYLGALLTREPGGTLLGEQLRALVLDPEREAPSDRAEALIIAAARAQHVAEVVGPALAAGTDVVTDRFIGSSLAYQGIGRDLGVAEVAAVSAFATNGLEADLTLFIEVDEATAAERMNRSLDRIEQAGEGFHRRVAEAYQTLAAADPDRWVVIDGVGTVDEVTARVMAAVADRLS